MTKVTGRKGDIFDARPVLDVAVRPARHAPDRRVLIRGGLADRVLAAQLEGESFRDTVYRLLNAGLSPGPAPTTVEDVNRAFDSLAKVEDAYRRHFPGGRLGPRAAPDPNWCAGE